MEINPGLMIRTLKVKSRERARFGLCSATCTRVEISIDILERREGRERRERILRMN